jgi:hypothetical protein
MDLHLSEEAYICGMEWRTKQLASPQAFTPLTRGLYEGQLLVWDEPDAHGDIFTRNTVFHIYGEPPVYLEHNYFSAPVGKIVYYTEREDGLYIGLKMDTGIDLSSVEGTHLSIGGFARGQWRDDGYYELTEFAMFEASLTRTPAQPNKEIALLMKTVTDMTTGNENATAGNANAQVPQNVVAGNASNQTTQKAAPEPANGQTTQKVVTAPAPLGYLRKQDLAQLEAFVEELSARVVALEELKTQVADLQQKVADLSATVSQLQGIAQDAATKARGDVQKFIEENVQPVVKEMTKNMLLIVEALKMTKK